MGYAAEYPIDVFFDMYKGFMGGKHSSIKSMRIIPFLRKSSMDESQSKGEGEGIILGDFFY